MTKAIARKALLLGTLLIILSVGMAPSIADAQATIGSSSGGLLPKCDPVPLRYKDGLETCGFIHLFALLVNIYNLLLGLAAFVVMIFIIFGGIRMFYWGMVENSTAELESAKFTVRRALFGFGLIIAAYLIVNTVIALLGGGGITDVLQPLQGIGGN